MISHGSSDGSLQHHPINTAQQNHRALLHTPFLHSPISAGLPHAYEHVWTMQGVETVINIRQFRRLVYRGEIPDDHLSIHYSSLRTLHVHIQSKDDIAFRTIIINHPFLAHLELRQQAFSWNTGWSFSNALSNLSTLRLIGVALVMMNRDVFWDACSRLQTLDLQFNIIKPPYGPTEEAVWEMKDLSLVFIRWMTISTQLRLIRRCPKLRRLHWTPDSGPRPMRRFVQSVLENTWPMLEDLCLDDTKVSDQDLSIIIGKMQRIIGLSVAHTHFNSMSMTALQPHLHWLQRLNISGTLEDMDDVTSSEFTIMVLKSCPQLEFLKANGVPAEYLMNDAPWACEKSLRILELSFEITPIQEEHDSQQEAIIGRLMKFVNLERLEMSNSWSGSPIGFQLRHGLAKLATLTKLQELILPSKPQLLSIHDVEWMIEHWKNLKSIAGTLCWSHDDPQTLIDRFSVAGIGTQKLIVDRL
ncbi:hypothetical protein B0O80DRAFT_429791 [Mortierella sp. GBAus27b]|nr:hypothetical protein B0O80DRAFT_429791 [Mortierella sp. GBAus27b]